MLADIWRIFGADIIRFCRDVGAIAGVLISVQGIEEASLPSALAWAFKIAIIYAVILALKEDPSK